MIEERQLTIEDAGAMEGGREFFTEPPLSTDEQARFSVYEAAIEASFSAQTAGVLAAEQIRTERLWRGKWGSFDDYCLDRWQVSQEQMNRRIRAARVIQALGSISTGNEPEKGSPKSISTPNVQQAVELSKLDEPDEQREVWQEVVAQATKEQPVTAKRVEEAVQAHKEQKAAAAAPDARARALELAGQLPCERDSARGLVTAPGIPLDRAVDILERLHAMDAEESGQLLRQWQSSDQREQSAALAAMQGTRAPADPRRMILETWLPELERCARMFPGDAIEEPLRDLALTTKEIISAIRAQEQERWNGTEAA